MANPFLRRLVKENMGKLSETDLKLANYLTQLDNELVNKTISQLSIETDISQTTIFNFVKKLGFKGFQDFKITLASNLSQLDSENALTAFSDIAENDTSLEIAQKIIAFNTQSLISLSQSFKQENLDRVITLMQSSNALHFFGLGGSTIVAYDSYHKFIRTKFLCNYIGNYHMQLSYATKLSAKDCVFLFSHSGQTNQTINLAKAINHTDAKLIALTGNSNSELGKYVDESIIVYSEESKFRTETLTSRILYLTVMDILYTNIMYSDVDESQTNMDRIRSVIQTTKNTQDYIL